MSTASQCFVKISLSRPLPDCRASSTGSSSPPDRASAAWYASSCWKAGVSSSLSRMYRPMMPIGPATKNGMRQPQSVIPSVPRTAVSTVTRPEPSE